MHEKFWIHMFDTACRVWVVGEGLGMWNKNGAINENLSEKKRVTWDMLHVPKTYTLYVYRTLPRQT